MKTNRKLQSDEIEVAIAEYFNPRQNLIIPNMYWSYFEYELDLLVLTKSGYAYEIEIKTTLSDLKRDLQKEHKHHNTLIKRIYFAIPGHLLKNIDYIPEAAGILTVDEIESTNTHWGRGTFLKTVEERPAKNKSTHKFTELDRQEMTRLAALRIWTIKKKLIRERKRYDVSKKQIQKHTM